jgi:2-dehydro-3-deoxyglucarate aldolase/4-hydroxy-2-oxoheptanedioate aldolase
MKPNRFREALEEGRTPLGHMIMEFATRGIAKLLEGAGVDFVLLDMEHTGFDAGCIADQIAWFKATPIAPFVRVPQNHYHFLARTMDAGALGVMVGNVETPEAARQIVDAVKYAPMGRRGVGLGTAHNDYIMPDPVRYFEYANANTTVICQIESPIGLANLDGIAATPGVDVLWVGHFDLSQSMGIAAQFQHPDFLAALKKVVETAGRYGKHAGIQPGNLEQAEQWMAIGYDVVSWSSDVAVYRTALNSGVAQLRERAARTVARGA